MRAWILAAALLLTVVQIAVAAPTFPPGSRIGLVPAEGMRLSQGSSHFENPAKYASVRLKEMRPDEYPLLESTLLNSPGKDLKIIFTERTTIGGHPAVLVTVNQTSQLGFLLRKWLLAVREPTLTIFIVVQSIDSPAGYSDVAIRRMLNSVVARASVPLDTEMSAQPFVIEEKAGFRPVKISASTVALTDGPSDDLYLYDQPVVLVAFDPMRSPPRGKESVFASKLFMNDPNFTEKRIRQSQFYRHQGRARHELVGEAKDPGTGKPLVILQTLEYDARGILRIVSMTGPGLERTHLPRFRSLADGIEIRR